MQLLRVQSIATTKSYMRCNPWWTFLQFVRYVHDTVLFQIKPTVRPKPFIRPDVLNCNCKHNFFLLFTVPINSGIYDCLASWNKTSLSSWSIIDNIIESNHTDCLRLQVKELLQFIHSTTRGAIAANEWAFLHKSVLRSTTSHR